MSSLIFYSDADQVLVATDTLAVTLDGTPCMFTTKATYIPHLKTIVAGTGAGGFANSWALQASTRMIARGIHNLDCHTPGALRKNWKDYKAEYSLLDDCTTTVYQFGLSEETDQIVGFAYRSTSNFNSEALGYGVGVKPECTIPNYNIMESIPSMMNEQRQIQEKETDGKKIHIGGEIYAIHLTKQGCTLFKMAESSDFRTQEAAIFMNHEKGKR
jgi:hypothetical protein